MSKELTRERRIETIVQTLRPIDPESWPANIMYVTAEFDSYDKAQRATIQQLEARVKELERPPAHCTIIDCPLCTA